MAQSPATVRATRRLPQAGLFLAALALFLTATYFTLTQALRPFPLKPDTAWEGFYYPVERNAHARMPQVSENLNDVFVVPDSGEVWVVGAKGLILHGRDGGANWERSGLGFDGKPATGADLNSVSFSDRAHGWAVGGSGTILATADGGRTWRPQAGGGKENLYGVQFLADGQRGWAVGDGGTLLATEDGGKTWQTRDSAIKKWLQSANVSSFRSLQFLENGHRGWVAGSGGTILATADGGRTWEPQVSGRTENFFDVEFLADGLRGWVAGGSYSDMGVILETSDGGKTWRADASGATENFQRVRFLRDGKRGWAAGRGVPVLVTADGGRTWQSQASRGKQDFSDVAFLEDGRHGWAVGAQGTLLATADGGESWQLQAVGPGESLSAVQFLVDGSRGWAVGSSGTILATADGGESWQPRASGTEGFLYGLAFLENGQQGWAVGDGGRILTTADRGDTWQARSSANWHDHRSVEFLADGQRGWIVGRGGTILVTGDGGAHWTRQAEGFDLTLNDVQFLKNGQRGWAVGNLATILATTDGGKHWRGGGAAGSTSSLAALQILADGQRGWAVGDNGTILVTADGGRTWQPQTSGSRHHLLGLRFLAEGRQGWAVGSGGTIMATQDSGQLWQPEASGGSGELRDLAFLGDGRRGWVVGQGFAILGTEDGGKTWHSVAYRRYPAPWYWLASAFALALGWLALRHRLKSAETTIADLLASDRPLRPGDPDALNYSAIAAGVSRFLRNPRTEPPLTLAVSGEWGTGKSSLMNLIRHDVAQAGFATVWFNAWHHQKGEQLLASLFANIRAQALPKAFSRVGLRFRLNLLARRSRRHWLLALALTGFGGLALAFLLSEASHLGQALRTFSAEGDGTPDWWQALLKSIPELGALATLGVSLYRAVQGFGLNPSKLIASVTAGTGKPAPLHPGARFQFVREFEDVTAALKPGRLVIFIDDLDRCSKENVVEVLESINFLVSSGDCFIVLGMAREWVETCVALGFKELAEETSDAENPAGHRDYRREFARKYLQKLINIEVPLPRLDAGDSLRLLPRAPAEEAPASLLEQGWRGFSAWLQGWRNALVLAGLAAVGLALGWGLKPRFAAWVDRAAQSVSTPKPDQKQELELPLDGRLLKAVGGSSAGLSEGEAPAPPEGTALVLRTDWEALMKGIVLGRVGEAEWVLKYQPGPFVGPPEPTATPAEAIIGGVAGPQDSEETPPIAAPPYTPGQENAAPSAWLPLAPGLAFTGLALWWLLRSPVQLTEDSEDFLAALALWHPWIAAACPTPRLVKRFLNRLRYLAMRHRPPDSAPMPWFRRTWARLKRRPPPESPAEPGFDERALVALGAIYEFRKEWVVEDVKFGRLAEGQGEQFIIDESFETADSVDGTVERAAAGRRRLNQSSMFTPLQALSKSDWEKARGLRERFLAAVGAVRMD